MYGAGGLGSFQWGQGCPLNSWKHRPLVGGVSIGTYWYDGGWEAGYTGSLCAIVRDKTDGKIVMLSNNHVLGRKTVYYDTNYEVPVQGQQQVVPGTYVLQPSWADYNYWYRISEQAYVALGYEPVGAWTDEEVAVRDAFFQEIICGEVKRVVPIQLGTDSDQDNQVDCGIASINQSLAYHGIFKAHVGPYPFAAKDEYATGDFAYISSRTTGYKSPDDSVSPYIASTTATTNVLYNESKIGKFTNQIMITSEEGNVSRGGDSGSPVLVYTGNIFKLAGIVFAGPADYDDVYVNHMEDVAEQMNIEAWDGRITIDTDSYAINFEDICYHKIKTVKKAMTHVPEYLYGNCQECENPVTFCFADEYGAQIINSIWKIPVKGEATIEKAVYLWFDKGDPQDRTPKDECSDGQYKITNVRITVANMDESFSGGTNQQGQECVDEKWISLRSDGVRTHYCDEMIDDNQSTFKAVGGGFTNASDYLAVGDFCADSARRIFIKITVPEGVESEGAVFPRLMVQYNVENESSSSESQSSSSVSSVSSISSSSLSSYSSSSLSSLSSSSSSSADSKSSSSSSESSSSSDATQQGIFYPAASADDGQCLTGGTGFSNSGNFLTLGDSGGSNYRIFIRFANVTIPEGAVIQSAFVRLTAGFSLSDTACNVDIRAQDEDNPDAPADAGEVTGAQLGTQVVNWDSISGWTDGTQYDTPDLTDVIQQIVGRNYWDSGDALIIHMIDDASTDNAVRYASAYDYLSAAEKAELHVTWVEGSASSSSSSISSSESSSSESSLSSSSESSLSSSLSSSSESSLSSSLSSSSSSSESSESSSESSESSSSSSSAESKSSTSSYSSLSSSSESSDSSSSESSLSSSSESSISSSSDSSDSSSSSSSSDSSSSESSSESKSDSSSSSESTSSSSASSSSYSFHESTQEGTFTGAANEDDGYCYSDSTGFTNTGSGIWLGSVSDKYTYAFFRFTSVTIPQGSTIRNAYIRFDVDQATRTGDTQLEIVAHDADDVAAGDIDSAAEITGASVTAAIGWPDVESFYTGNQYDTPDITSALNTVVNRGSWSSGNAVCIQVRDNGSSLNHNRYVNSWDYTSGSGDVPKLIVDWLVP
jgi:hypothetical protein